MQRSRTTNKASDIGERFAALSRRQQQVVSLVCNGLTNKITADKLGVNEGTVKSHLHAIYDKLGVQSRIALMIASPDRRPPIDPISRIAQVLRRSREKKIGHASQQKPPLMLKPASLQTRYRVGSRPTRHLGEFRTDVEGERTAR